VFLKSSEVRRIAYAALLMALDIILTRFLSPLFFEVDRVGFQVLANAVSGALLGPVWAAITCAAADVAGMFINSAGKAYIPHLTLSAALRGFWYGAVLYKKPVSPARCLIAVGIVAVTVEILLNTTWMTVLFNFPWLEVLKIKMITRPVSVAVFGPLLYVLLRALRRSGVISFPG